jgi:hypothetical protein
MEDHKKLSKIVFIIAMGLMLVGILYLGYTDGKNKKETAQEETVSN